MSQYDDRVGVHNLPTAKEQAEKRRREKLKREAEAKRRKKLAEEQEKLITNLWGIKHE